MEWKYGRTLALLGRTIGMVCMLGVLVMFVGCNLDTNSSEVRRMAARIHAQMQRGDYSLIYNQSAPRFKSVGSETKFISVMNEFRTSMGSIKKAQEIAYTSGLDSSVGTVYTLLFDLDCEHGEARERMIFARSQEGEMQLWKLDINPK